MATTTEITVYTYVFADGAGLVTGCNETDAIQVLRLLGLRTPAGNDRLAYKYPISSASDSAREVQRNLRSVRAKFPEEFALLAKPSRDFADAELPRE